MDKKFIEMLKKDLAKAVKEKNLARIKEIRDLLNISSEQEKYFERGLTGFPSVDMPHLKYYGENAYERATNIPVDKTVWDVIEKKLEEYYDVPAIEYFKKIISRSEFVDRVYEWARTFRAMGVDEDEVVPIYGPFTPDVCAMTFALNMIGAVPYFLKLEISEEALAEETRESKIAVVYDGMWGKVASEFSKPKFKNVIVTTITEDMPSPKKEIVSFLSKMQALKNKSSIPDEKKYIWLDKAKEIANYYSGEVKVPFVPNRNAFITSSSGTTVGGVVKGTIATNETTLAQLYMADASNVLFFKGDKVLNHFPPTASTSLNILCFLPLYRGMTVWFDPRVSDKDFYNQLVYGKPQLAVNTGSKWESFFIRVEREMNHGKKFDFSYAKGWVVGGEGTDVNKFMHWREIMAKCNAPLALGIAYGTSEAFSAISTESSDAPRDKFDKPVMNVGIPYAGFTVGVYDEEGNELSYNQRGELGVKSPSIMKGYYQKEELTKKAIVDGTLFTGDMAEIDEDGFIYIWGRKTNSIELANKEKLYLFDVEVALKKFDFIDDAIVLLMPSDDNQYNLVAHIVLKEKDDEDLATYIEQLNEGMANFLPKGVYLDSYSVHDTMLPYSPTTLKKDRNGLSKQTAGYFQVIDGELNKVTYIPKNDSNKLTYSKIYATYKSRGSGRKTRMIV